jgi:hypothetical protein
MQADITCDSDGVLNHFISTRDAVDFDPILPLHELRTTEPYPLAMFLTGDAVEHKHRWEPAAGILCQRRLCTARRSYCCRRFQNLTADVCAGVYQEVMGSSHNMLGAPHVAEIRLATDHMGLNGATRGFNAARRQISTLRPVLLWHQPCNHAVILLR